MPIEEAAAAMSWWHQHVTSATYLEISCDMIRFPASSKIFQIDRETGPWDFSGRGDDEVAPWTAHNSRHRQANIIMVPNENNNDNNCKGLLSQAREYIHEAVKTDEIRLEERPISEKIVELVPTSTTEITESIQNAFDDIKDKFSARLDEGTEREFARQNESNFRPIETIKDQVKSARETIYEATKSQEQKEVEAFQQKPFFDKLQVIQESAARDDLTPPDLLLD